MLRRRRRCRCWQRRWWCFREERKEKGEERGRRRLDANLQLCLPRVYCIASCEVTLRPIQKYSTVQFSTVQRHEYRLLLERSGGTVGSDQPVRRSWKKRTRQMVTSSFNHSVATVHLNFTFSLLRFSHHFHFHFVFVFGLGGIKMVNTWIGVMTDSEIHGQCYMSSMQQPSLIFQSRQQSEYQRTPR